jgi:hypothetical protein
MMIKLRGYFAANFRTKKNWTLFTVYKGIFIGTNKTLKTLGNPKKLIGQFPPSIRRLEIMVLSCKKAPAASK